VTWTYEVCNNGNVDLDVTVTDSELGEIVSGVLLPAGDCMTFEQGGFAQEGEYTNSATVSATNDCGGECSATDDSSYFGAKPGIDIDKKTNGEDGGVCVPVDSIVEWTYIVTNTGNTPLSNVTVVDDQGVAVGCPGIELGVGESMTCTASGPAQVGQYENEATVTASYQCEGVTLDVSDADTSDYFGATCDVSIDKKTNGEDDGVCIPVGAPVTWTYEVCNGSNVPVDIVVIDSEQGEIASGIILPPGECMTFEKEGIAQEGEYTNSATVNATNECGGECSAIDDSSYFGALCDIEILKFTNDEDGPCLIAETEVTWTYIVSNVGNVALGYEVTDDKLGFICNGRLEPGQSETCMKTGVVQEGLYENVATVTGINEECGEACVDIARDPSSYFGAKCGIDIEKYTNGEDADEGPGPEIPIGEKVTWTYKVDNTGNVKVDYVVTDDKLGEICKGSLEPGQSVECTAEGIAEIGPYENSATVVATNEECGVRCDDTDPSHYTGIGLFQGCTPGYWKNHPEDWVGYAPEDLVGDVFEASKDLPTEEPTNGKPKKGKSPEKPIELAKDSLMTALDYPGGAGVLGAARILLRASIAALLNASHPDLNYEIAKPEDVIKAVDEALASKDRDTMLALAAKLDEFNNAGCFDDMEAQEEPEAEEEAEDASLAPEREGPPRTTVLGQNVRNPFNPDTWIPFKLANDADVKIEIYDVTGRLVRRLDLGYRPAGSYWDRSRAAYWDGRNEAGELVASGVYFYRMTAGDFTATKRMVLLK
jgi:hypothetical protein